MSIIVTDLTKTYPGGVQALNRVTLTIPPGMFGLLGPNGAGKTTLMRILTGIVLPTSGHVALSEHDLSTRQGRHAAKTQLGYLPQDFGTYPDLSAFEFLDYLAILKGMQDRKARREHVEHLLETVALHTDARRRLKTYSGGMKRRIGIAQALLGDPSIVIVDEPTAGLDPEERLRFRNLLSQLSKDRTVLLSTHIVEDVAQTCQNLAILKGGQVLFQGTSRELIERTRGRVWAVTTDGPRPEGGGTVVSQLQLGSTVQYRVVGTPASSAGSGSITPVEPTLEDGYVWLMQRQAVRV